MKSVENATNSFKYPGTSDTAVFSYEIIINV